MVLPGAGYSVLTFLKKKRQRIIFAASLYIILCQRAFEAITGRRETGCGEVNEPGYEENSSKNFARIVIRLIFATPCKNKVKFFTKWIDNHSKNLKIIQKKF